MQKNMKKCLMFVYPAFFQKSLCSKNPIWGIFSLKMGHFFVPRGWKTLVSKFALALNFRGAINLRCCAM